MNRFPSVHVSQASRGRDFDERKWEYISSCDPEVLWFGTKSVKSLGAGSFGSCRLVRVPCPDFLTAAAEAAGQSYVVSKGIPVVIKCLRRSMNPVIYCEEEVAACQATSTCKYLPRLLTYSHVSYGSFLVFEGISSKPRNVADAVSDAACSWYGSRQLPLDKILKLHLHASRGLKNLHRLHWCHNDIKPENLVFWEGGAYLIDMGLATVEGDSCSWDPKGHTGLGSGGNIHGTELFMEPHVVESQKRDGLALMDSSRDWYALGLTLVFILAKGNISTVLEARGITSKVQQGTVGVAEGVKQLLALLRTQLAAVTARYEQQLEQRGVVQHAEVAAAGGVALEKMLEVLLLMAGQKRWSNDELEQEMAKLEQQVEAVLRTQQ
jgi:hypothetical protein